MPVTMQMCGSKKYKINSNRKLEMKHSGVRAYLQLVIWLTRKKDLHTRSYKRKKESVNTHSNKIGYLSVHQNKQ